MAIRLKNGAVIRPDVKRFLPQNRRGDFGDLDDRSNDESSWRIGLSAMPSLTPVVEALRARPSLRTAPVGNYGVIERYINARLADAAVWNGGDLPGVFYAEVADSPITLALPSGAMTPSFTAVFEAAAARGVESIGQVTDLIAMAGDDTAKWQEHEDRIRARIEADDSFDGATDEEIEDEVRRQLRMTEESLDEPTDQQARTILRGFLRDENPRASEAELDDLVDARIEENERAGKGVRGTGATARQRTAAIAATASGVLDVVNGAIDSDVELPVDTAAVVLEAIAGVCSIVGTALSSVPIAAAVLQIVAAVLEVVAAILRAIREYTVGAEEGVNAEWNERDLIHILSGRLISLCQCDDELVGRNMNATLRAAAAATNDERRVQMLKDFVYRTAKNRGEERVQQAQAICEYFGGGSSYRWCNDIRSWLLYVGVKEDEAERIFAWLYAARQYTEVTKWQRRVSESVGSYGTYSTGYTRRWMNNDKAFCTTSGHYCEHYGRVWVPSENAWWQCPCDQGDLGSPGLAGHQRGQECAGSSSARPNIWKGSADWYRVCQGPALDQDGRYKLEFTTFTIDDLFNLHKMLIEKLNVRFVHSDGTVDALIQAYEGGGPSERVDLFDYWSSQLARVPGARRVLVDGWDVFAAPGLIRADAPGIMFGVNHVQTPRGSYGYILRPTAARAAAFEQEKLANIEAYLGHRPSAQENVTIEGMSAARRIELGIPRRADIERAYAASSAFRTAVARALGVGAGGAGGLAGLAVVAGVAGVAAALLLKKR